MIALAEAVGLSVRFGAYRAVDGVDLRIEGGEILGLLGANGAGKTTLIRLLLGLLRPSAGDARLFGLAPSTETRRRVGYVPQNLGLYADMTVRENWQFSAAAFGIRHAEEPEAISSRAGELIGTVPLGAQRQVAFAIALAHRPELLVLDEPTSGVGPLGRARLWEEVREVAERGTGVLVTTHNMEEALQCDRLVIMLEGRVALAGTVAAIVGSRLVVEVRTPNWHGAFAALDADRLDVRLEGTTLRVQAEIGRVEEVLARAAVEATCREVPADLEEAFVAIVGEGVRRERAGVL